MSERTAATLQSGQLNLAEPTGGSAKHGYRKGADVTPLAEPERA